ncbi:DUF1499 domain-containing protein [Stenomitos frigidus]|uniref:DUF1499 domain-containing protein n=1 Tax=Stenomitos frigidus ULC18 TaxID=2107698 RepID=A0A2T1E6B3_9CYAN|nr:DUF1499 domain-containing protein [Stenomitos frigidus]PSB28287.1 DUF1499 domain-containing protein [Stenomitos frigidus ULC18]
MLTHPSDEVRPSWKARFLPTLLVVFTSLLLTATGCLAPVASASALPLPSAPVLSALFSLAGTRPANLGVVDGKFAPCPTTPNCVSSQSQDKEHAIDPLRYTSTSEDAFSKLKAMLEAQPRVNILTTTDDYIRTEFTIPIVGFVDDVEFYLDRAANLIQVRSASRLGESDLGVNRKRIETLRTKMRDEG